MTSDQELWNRVLAAERRLAEAVLTRDRSAAEAVLDPAFFATGHAGNVVDRSTYLDIHFAPERRFTEFSTSAQRIDPVGTHALVTGDVQMINANLTVNPPPARYAALYAPEGDSWRLRYWQETPIDSAAHF